MDKKAIEARLSAKLKELQASLGEHDRRTSEVLPENFVEAVPEREEMEIVESAEVAESREIDLIRDALDRLEAGTYGTCPSCARPIAPERLEVMPWAERCVNCESRHEKDKRRK